jgi:hypothetical protein
MRPSPSSGRWASAGSLSPAKLEGVPDPQVYWPGDFPLPEHFIALMSFIACGCLLAAAVAWWRSGGLVQRHERSKWWLAAALICLLCAAPSISAIYERNTGRWAGLKAFLQGREAALHRFKNAHPELSKEQIVKSFRLSDPGPWRFQIDPNYGPVTVYPTLMADGPRMAVNFGGPGSDIAIFDPDTMWVVFSL